MLQNYIWPVSCHTSIICITYQQQKRNRIYKRYRKRPVASLREVDNLFPFPGYVVVPPVLMYKNSDEGCACQIVNYSKPVHPLPPSVHLGIKMSLLAKKQSGFQGLKQWPFLRHSLRNQGSQLGSLTKSELMEIY